MTEFEKWINENTEEFDDEIMFWDPHYLLSRDDLLDYIKDKVLVDREDLNMIFKVLDEVDTHRIIEKSFLIKTRKEDHIKWDKLEVKLREAMQRK